MNQLQQWRNDEIHLECFCFGLTCTLNLKLLRMYGLCTWVSCNERKTTIIPDAFIYPTTLT